MIKIAVQSSNCNKINPVTYLEALGYLNNYKQRSSGTREDFIYYVEQDSISIRGREQDSFIRSFNCNIIQLIENETLKEKNIQFNFDIL